MELTGLAVPGFTLPCEIPEINTWAESQNAPGILNPEATVGTDGQICAIGFEFVAGYTEEHKCEAQPFVLMYLEAGIFATRNLVLGEPAPEDGGLTLCQSDSSYSATADILQLEACAISLGCDITPSAQ